MSNPKLKQFQDELNDLVYRYISDAVRENDKQLVDDCLIEMFHVAGHLGLTALVMPSDFIKLALEGFQDATACLQAGLEKKVEDDETWENWVAPEPEKDFGSN